MSYREVSEVRDGMRIDWDVPIKMDDGLVLRADVYRPVKRGPLSGHPDLRPVRQGAALPGRLQDRLGAHVRRSIRTCRPAPPTSTRTGRWSIRRSGCRTATSASASTRAAPAARRAYLDIWSPRETRGPLRLHRVGRRAALVERQGRPERHLLLRRATSGSAPRCSRRISPRSASGRAPPTSTATWRTTAASLCTFRKNWYDMQVEDRAARPRRARLQEPHDRRLGVGPGDADRGGARRQPRRTSARTASRTRSTTDDYWQSRMPDWSKVKVPLLSAANWGGQGLHPRGNFEGFVARRLEAEVARGARHSSTGRTSTPTTASTLQKRFFDHFLKGEKTGWDKQPKVQLQVRHPATSSSSAHENEWPLARTQVDEVLSSTRRTARCRPSAPAKERRSTYEALGDGVTFLDRRRWSRRPRSPARSAAKLLRLVGDRGRRPVPGAARVSTRQEGGRVPGRARSAHADRAGLAARLAPQARPEADRCPTGPYHTARRDAAARRRARSYELDVEIWPTCIVVPTGYRIALTRPRQGLRISAAAPAAAVKT